MGKHWNLYATNRRVGTYKEHRLAGARIGRFGVRLSHAYPYGWRAEIYVSRFEIELQAHPRQSDPLWKDFYEAVMPPRIRKQLTQSEEDIDQGRGYRFDARDDGRSIPLASWKADDPEQPDGWHHDGKRWVINETGWFKDRYGWWRYNHPGDPGWKEKEDGSWMYVKA
jgi:hypothetical protein